MVIKYLPYLISIYFLITKQINLLTFFVISQILNDFIVKNLFKCLMKDRVFPVIGSGNRPNSDLKSYGMPSSHALAVGFLLASQPNYWPITSIITIVVLKSRYTNGHHTPQQLLIGLLAGLCLGNF